MDGMLGKTMMGMMTQASMRPYCELGWLTTNKCTLRSAGQGALQDAFAILSNVSHVL